MGTLLQVIGSIILFGLFLITLLSFEGNITSVSHQITFDKISQENIVYLVELFDHDISKIGFRKQAPKLKPGFLDSTSIIWYSDYDNNELMDSIKYYLGDIQSANSPNPNIRLLYRKINNDSPLTVGLGIVYLNFSYFDSSMTQINYSLLNNISNVNKIRGIKVKIRVETQYKFSKNYSSSYWEKIYLPRNLNL